MNIERLKQAIKIIEAIPDEKLNLRVWKNANESIGYVDSMEKSCGTIACAAGWLAMHPEMQAQGWWSGLCGQPVYQREKQTFFGFDALQMFFELRDSEAYGLFKPRYLIERSGDRAALSDKEIWLMRANRFLETENAS